MQVQAANGKRSIGKFEGARRLSLSDLTESSQWILDRLLKVHPHLNERSIAGYIRSLIDSNESLFLFQPNSIALAQVDRAFVIDPRPVVRIRYVIARSKEHINEAAEFYLHIREWARHMNAEFVMLGDVSDVPLSVIQQKMGKTFEKNIVYARV